MSKQLRQKKNNDPFLQLQLADVTGQVTANIWNNAVEADKRFESGHVLEIVGLITTYQDRLQITIERLRRVRQTEINLADCPPGTTGEPDEFAPSNAVYSEPGQWLPTDDNTVQSAMAERATARRAQELAAKYARDGPESPEEARQLQENYKGRREGWKGTGRR